MRETKDSTSVTINFHRQTIPAKSHTQIGHIACGVLVLREPGVDDQSRDIVDLTGSFMTRMRLISLETMKLAPAPHLILSQKIQLRRGEVTFSLTVYGATLSQNNNNLVREY